jgi:hypothetical protein
MLVLIADMEATNMGPIIGVPDDLARRLEDETDLVEVDHVLPDVVDELDVQLGSTPGDILLLVETPRDGFGRLVTFLTDYAKSAPRPFELTVRDKDGNTHPFPAHTDVSEQAIRDQLKLAYFGEPGDRRPLIRDGDSPSS